MLTWYIPPPPLYPKMCAAAGAAELGWSSARAAERCDAPAAAVIAGVVSACASPEASALDAVRSGDGDKAGPDEGHAEEQCAAEVGAATHDVRGDGERDREGEADCGDERGGEEHGLGQQHVGEHL